LKVVDLKNVVSWLLAMMMENVSNTTTETNATFTLMMENPNISAINMSARFAFKVFYFLSRVATTLLLMAILCFLHCFQLQT
jgi:hypothetical protein